MHPVVFMARAGSDSHSRAGWHPGGSLAVQVSSTKNFLYNLCVFDVMFCKVNGSDTRIK